ncbi:helix-turn-helix domain-containing protein, partial [Streptomyces boluensis]
MTERNPAFDAVDALLASAVEPEPLPPVEERRVLREHLGLSRAQVAAALGVSPSTVGGWESGRDPAGEVRGKYAYFLDAARTKLADRSAEPRPCVLCGGPATDEIEGYPQHLDPQECVRSTAPRADRTETSYAQPAPQPAPEPAA